MVGMKPGTILGHEDVGIVEQVGPAELSFKPGNRGADCVEALAKAGTFSTIGAYLETVRVFPIGMAMNKSMPLKVGNCDHRKYIPYFIELLQSQAIDPAKILTPRAPLLSGIEACHAPIPPPKAPFTSPLTVVFLKEVSFARQSKSLQRLTIPLLRKELPITRPTVGIFQVKMVTTTLHKGIPAL